MLLGRGAELEQVDHLLESARAGRSGSLVVRGAAGAGKTELLLQTQSAAGDLRVLRTTGVVAEQDLPFAALHQLLRPALGLLDALPSPQRRALDAALALAPGEGADRFLVSAAVLSLLAECAGDQGLLCLVDDAHWLDRPSLDALLFAARRLDAEGIVVLFGVREGEDALLLAAGLPSLRLGGLRAEDTAQLLADRSGVTPAPAVVADLLTATGGNALALTELAQVLSAAQLSGRARLPDPLPVSEGMEHAFLGRMRSLPPDTQLLALVAAAEGTGDFDTIVLAAALLDVEESALDAGEQAGLLVLDAGVLAFRHPLVRSAVYGGARSSQRRRVHEALAQVLTGPEAADRRAWHRAAATVGYDDEVGDELAQTAQRARSRSGFAAAATSLRRAAALTGDPALRARRLVDSASDAWLGAMPDQALAALDAAEPLVSDPALRDEVTHLRGRFELRRGVASDAYRIFVDGAAAAAPGNPRRALQMLAEASEAASYVGDLAGMIEAGRLAELVAADDDAEAEYWRDQCAGVADLLAGRPAAGAARLGRIVVAATEDASDPQRIGLAAQALVYLGQVHLALDYFERAAAAARVADMTGNLPYVLEYLAASEETLGHYAVSESLSEEGLGLAGDTGQESSRCQHLANLAILAARRGDDDACRRYAEETLRLSLPRRLGFPAARASWALAILDLGAGRFEEAHTRLRELAEVRPGAGHPAVAFASFFDRAEAAVRCGELADAHAVLDQYAPTTAHASAWPRGVMTCCRALVAGDEQAGDLFEESLALHKEGRTPPPHLARTHLLYGEWLRRSRRRTEARVQLRAATELFENIGATPWAARARGELRATGESGRRDNATRSLNDLTPQERRIAEAVAEGSSTRQVATQMFLSPRTVEYHLHKIYPKLGIATRTELARIVATEPALAAPKT